MRVSHLAKLVRLDSSLLAALALFVPLLARTKDVAIGAKRALPILLIGMCTFIANDLDDIEKDRTNHPGRPLPAGHVSPATACAFYFGCLTLALLAIKWLVEPGVAFWYYGLLTLSISYSYVVDFSPGLKTPYVALALSVPVFIAARFFPDDYGLFRVAAAVFLFTLGRELCMDLADRAGDAPSFMHRIPAKHITGIALSCQLIGLACLLPQAHSALDLGVIATMASLVTLTAYYWFRLQRHASAIGLMKLQLLIGLYFLL